jgi:alanine racemase
MKNQHSSTTLAVNLNAVRENYRILKKEASNAKVSAVVKANAYGLGVAAIAPQLNTEGCDSFFVANLDEALELRQILPHVMIFVLHGILSGQEACFTQNNLRPVLNSTEQINIWQQHAIKKRKTLPCIIHFDTGMNRLGISASKVNGQHGFSIENTATLDIKYIMSHLACADEKEHAKNSEQLIEFKSLAKKFTGIKLSIANSAGVFLGREYHLDMVRPGIALYGGNPTINSQNRMKNVIKLTSKILQIERVDSAGTVGYGATHKITRGTKIATIAVGYANGYLRSLSDRGICAVNGHIVPVIGRVSMDLVTIDVTKIPDEKLFDAEVELIGDYISVNEVAQKAGTISYEIITSLGGRYRIVYD